MAEYISREAVINITAETGAWETQNRVRELPSADVQPVKHSKWVAKVTPAFYGFSSDGDPIYRDRQFYQCENCSRRSVIKENYCPRCGARMDLKDGDAE